MATDKPNHSRTGCAAEGDVFERDRKSSVVGRGMNSEKNLAALFVDPRGPYSNRRDVDVWDKDRDARNYSGPWPVVAHPPCQLWVNFAALNFKRWGGEHNRPGNDGGCFASALASVRRWTGVLEHPAFSNAWAAHGLDRPVFGEWTEGAPGEWVTEVWQSAYGHLARKRTWLFYKGPRPSPMRWEKKPGTHQVGRFDVIKPVIAKRRASLTPEEFAEALISLAKSTSASSVRNSSEHDASDTSDPSLSKARIRNFSSAALHDTIQGLECSACGRSWRDHSCLIGQFIVTISSMLSQS